MTGRTANTAACRAAHPPGKSPLAPVRAVSPASITGGIQDTSDEEVDMAYNTVRVGVTVYSVR